MTQILGQGSIVHGCSSWIISNHHGVLNVYNKAFSSPWKITKKSSCKLICVKLHLIWKLSRLVDFGVYNTLPISWYLSGIWGSVFW